MLAITSSYMMLVVLDETRKECRIRTLCLFAICLMYDITSRLATESSPLVGSSKNTILGPVIS